MPAPDAPPGPAERRRQILTLALPIIGGMASQNLFNLVDTLMVGRGVGPVGLAAVGIGGMANWTSTSVFMAVGAGVQTIVARRHGEGSREGAVDALAAGLSLTATLGVTASIVGFLVAPSLFALFVDDPEVIETGGPYLQARLVAIAFVMANFIFRGFWNGIERSVLYMRTLLTVHATNIVLNAFLIFGLGPFPRLGALGAGIASAIAAGVGTLTYLVLASRELRGCRRSIRGRISRPLLATLVAQSIPNAIQGLLMSFGFLLFFAIAGTIGTSELAATNIVIQLLLVVILPSMGFGLGAATLVGKALGAGSIPEARAWGWATVRLSVPVAAAIGATLAIGAPLWLSVFTSDPDVIAAGASPLRLVGIVQFADAAGIVLMQSLIGAGAPRFVLFVSSGSQYALLLPAAAYLVVGLGFGTMVLFACLALQRGLMSLVFAWLWTTDRWTAAEV